ncbi:hypothetical protein [Streptomyces sparsus]
MSTPGSAPPPSGDRGATRSSRRAHERIAAGESPRGADVPVRLPRAAVRIRRGGARIKIGVVLPCPSDPGASRTEVRGTVATRAAESTGVPVSDVGVTGDGLTPPGSAGEPQ